jgi:hypothetical protein
VQYSGVATGPRGPQSHLEEAPGGRDLFLEPRHAAPTPALLEGCQGSLVGVQGGTCVVVDRRCKRWSCPDCNASKVEEARSRIIAGFIPSETVFLTLTLPGTAVAADSFNVLSAAFKLLHQRLRRLCPGLEWLAVADLQARGAAHLHALLRGAVLPTETLVAAAVASGFGAQLDHRPAEPHHIDYLLAPLQRAPSDPLPPYVRRVRWSRGWAPALQGQVRPAGAHDWYASPAPASVAAVAAEIRGYKVVALVTRRPNASWRGWRVPWFRTGTFGRTEAATGWSLPSP